MFLPATITLKFGDSGDFVTELQNRLVLVNCFSESMINGFYDGNTVNAVTSFQGREGLHADGVAGPDTLRRLNGVISGDTGGGPADKKEEEPAPVAPAQQFIWGAAPAAADPFAVSAPPAPAADIAPASMAPAPEPVQAAPEMRPVPPAPPPPVYDTLSALAQSPPTTPFAPPTPSPRELAGQHANPGTIPIAERPPLTAPAPPQAVPPAAAVPPPAPAAPANPQPAQTEPAAPQGLIGKAVQFANTMVQKLADYFQKNLPPSVLNEVHAIGQQMAREGVKEAPVPTGPADRAQELPGKAQEPAKQRG